MTFCLSEIKDVSKQKNEWNFPEQLFQNQRELTKNEKIELKVGNDRIYNST